MKKTIFTLFILFTMNTVFSQNKVEINLCGNTKNTIKKGDSNVKTISQEALFKCSELYSENPNYIINSFAIGMMTGKDYVAIKIEGNKITEKARSLINKHNPKKIYIEQINLVNAKRISSFGKPLVIILKK